MKVLLATDGSEYSEGAARFLTKLNFSPHDEIHILHAISWVPIMREWESLYVDFKTIREEIAPKILDSAAHILKNTGAKVSGSFTEDYPDRAIVTAAVDSGADLIVMGARGIRGLATHIVGSVTKLVAIHSPRPVLIIKPPQQETTGNFRILFATDGSVYSDAMVKILSLIPFPDNTEMTILNVVTKAFEDIPERFVMEINERIKNFVAGWREKELKGSGEILEKAYKDLSSKFSQIEKLTKIGDPSLEILNAADSINADIIAVGTSGMRGLKGMLGSVSRYILNHSKCSILIGKT